jgi:hypothetical protein
VHDSSTPSKHAQSQDCLQPSSAIQALDLKPPLKLNKSKTTTQTTFFGRRVGQAVEDDNDSSKPRKRKAAVLSAASAFSSSKPVAAAFLSSIPHYPTVRSSIPYQDLYVDAQRVLQETFGLEKLRNNLQPAAIQCALQQKSQFIVMATGGGKSLCYQLPATVLGGVTLVISPLSSCSSKGPTKYK